MENMIPLNGRIAIVDDQIEQALPLMRVFAKNNIPYVFYKGTDPEFLPEQPENDIRILFLDLNLLDGRDNQPKDIRSALFATIRRIISPNNYPYVLILWSRQEKEYRNLLEELFSKDLPQCAPIAILNWIKSDFFPNFTDTEENKEDEYRILDELKKTLSTLPAYSYLMQWENLAHFSTDELLKNIFSNAQPNEWESVANVIIKSLGKAYMGQHFLEATSEEKIKASLFALNTVYIDFLDNNLTGHLISSPKELGEGPSDTGLIEALKADINYKMHVFTGPCNICEPGTIIQYTTDPKNNYFEELLHKFLSIFQIRLKIKSETPSILDGILKKETSSRLHQIKEEIQHTWFKIGIVVTPSCDYAQKKKIYDRIVQGVMIESRFFEYINQGDAFYISPTIKYNDRNYIIILNFNYFITSNLNDEPNCKILFKLRRPILAEVQSKLARHINRQGIINL